ncbi:phosphoribosylamine--glycine ligase [Candidatus Woesearchaeota archaeon B3_Woes]|nr:MAG: phosphoribosylamine--glycine ligase [Candidatus Woesearchaeota archaeon B3_Woes]
MENVAVIGNGGREHALIWTLAQDKDVSEVIQIGAENAGIAQEEKVRHIESGIKKENFPDLLKIIEKENIGVTIVGPEGPLAEGLVDYLNGEGYDRVFGPTGDATKLESSKFFSAEVMKRANIPQADFEMCFSVEEAEKAIIKMATSEGIVIKADGLTGGKGVYVCDSRIQALEQITKHAKIYGEEVLISQRLFGQEFSVFGFSDGNGVYTIPAAFQDHKPLLDGDKGPNTGGMGAYGPAPIASDEVLRFVADRVMTPVVQQMKSLGSEYKGFLYAGMIMTEDGPKVLEFNARFGDPEAQPAMMMLDGSLYDSISLALDGKLDEIDLSLKPGASCCVVMASNGYPESPKTGYLIEGLEEASDLKGVKIFHAGTRVDREGDIIATGGRVLDVTAYSPKGLKEAQERVYEAVDLINVATIALNNNHPFYFRTDIGAKALCK